MILRMRAIGTYGKDEGIMKRTERCSREKEEEGKDGSQERRRGFSHFLALGRRYLEPC